MEQVRRQVFVMGTTATLEIATSSREGGVRRLEEMIAVLESTEAELSSWRESSAISRLNRQEIGISVATDHSLCHLLEKLEFWFERTGRAFDPAIGALIDVWGLRDAPRVPSPEELEAARNRSGFDQLQIDASTCETMRLGDIWIDAGAFGKGEALDRIAATSGNDRWMVNLGGQIMVYAPAGSDATWSVDIAHPAHRDQAVLEVTLTAGSVATSSGSERDVDTPEGRIGHILDPRTGQTIARPESVTVWHAEALVADILSTALYVMGVDEGFEWAESEGIAACFLIPDGDAVLAKATTAFKAIQ